MITVKYLGTCSGTEPAPNMHHTSLIIDVNGVNYWFEAGENCGFYAHTSGINVMDTKALFISHTHIDHTGGLANLLHVMKKLVIKKGLNLISNNTLKVFIPKKEILDCAVCLLNNGNTPITQYNLEYNGISDGVLFEDENVKVTALHNQHLREDGANGWHSFSFLIEAEGKKIVFSGDVKKPYELDELIGDGCDYLIHETGHHKLQDVIDYASTKNVKSLCFTHHGREIFFDRENSQKLVDENVKKLGMPIKIAHDLMIEKI